MIPGNKPGEENGTEATRDDVSTMSQSLPSHFGAFQRAKAETAVIVRRGPGYWVVQLADSEDAHVVRLADDDGSIRGECSCPNHSKGRETCSHLWATYLAHNAGVLKLTTPTEAIESDHCPTCEREIHTDEM